MTQYFDFVALAWIEEYLREEMDEAQSCLKSYVRETGETQCLRQALSNIHSVTAVLRLCALDPAALLTEEIECILSQLISGDITGEASKLALTEVVAATEALPAYLANVRAKREVSAGAIADVINDMRRFGNRSTLPDSLFFNFSIEPGAGISKGAELADERQLRQFAQKALRVCHQCSKPALMGDHRALKKLYAVGKHATVVLAGSDMEPYFRCYMGLIEAIAQSANSVDEVMVDVFRRTFVFLKSLARDGARAIDDMDPIPCIKKMLYYTARAPAPTALQQTLRDTFQVYDVDDVRNTDGGRLIQEDDLLEALRQTISQLLEVMEFMTTDQRNISAGNTRLVDTIVPHLRQVGIQLKAIGLTMHAETIAAQHHKLRELSLGQEPAVQSELLDFGGALMAVKESLEHKLKYGLSARGDSIGHELDVAIMEQTGRCLVDMKNNINREFARRDLLQLVEELARSGTVLYRFLRPVYRATFIVHSKELHEVISSWERSGLPTVDELASVMAKLLHRIPEDSYAEQAVAELDQVLSVLNLLADRKVESAVLSKCVDYIRSSIALGGLVNDAGMACFAEAVAALEEYMERNTLDPLGDSDEHLLRAGARAEMLVNYIEQRQHAEENAMLSRGFVEIDEAGGALAELEIEESLSGFSSRESDIFVPPREAGTEPATADRQGSSNVIPLTAIAAETHSNVGTHWRDALAYWATDSITRGPDAPLQDPAVDIDEDLVACFVEESQKYIRRLNDATPRFANSLNDETVIMEIRTIFHTMKGSARTIELFEFGEFMYDMEKIFNALRDGYISSRPEIALLMRTVAQRLPGFIAMMNAGVPIYTADFSVPHSIASAIVEKRFNPELMRVVSEEEAAAAEIEEVTVAVEEAPVAEIETFDAAEEKIAIDFTAVWEKPGAREILDDVVGVFEKNASTIEVRSLSGRALALLRALIPALVELRDGELLELDEQALGYFLDLPVIEQLASNAVFGLVDNGRGEFFKFPLSDRVTGGLKRYLDLLVEADQKGSAEMVESLHAEIQNFIRTTLALPDVRPAVEQTEANIADHTLARFELVMEPDDYEMDEVRIEVEQLAEAASAEVAEPETSESEVAEPETSESEVAEPEISESEVAEPEISESEVTAPAATVAMPPLPESEPEVAPERVAEMESPALGEDIDIELLELFIDTLDDYLDAIDAALARLSDGDVAGLQSLKNTLHTMKGSANSVGDRKLGAMLHALEGRLASYEAEGDVCSPEVLGKIYPLIDELHEAAALMHRRRAEWDGRGKARIDDDRDTEDEVIVITDTPEFLLAKAKRVDSLRVAAGKIDRLLETGLEVSMSNVRARRSLDAAQQDQSEVMTLARRVQTLVDKLSLQLDTEIQAKTESAVGLQFDPLEMDRMMEKQNLAAILREAAFDLQEGAREMDEHIDAAMLETVNASRLLESSQSEMRLLRLVSFSKLGPGFHRLVHQLGRELNKHVKFDITCEEGGLDVSVFDQVKTVLEHMLRNAVDHGIGTPEERIAEGKNSTGQVSLNIFRQSSEFIVRLRDDGRGLDPERLREEGVAQGLLSPEEKISDREAMRLIFHSGVSTVGEVTGVSGRGVGMDVVYQSIAQIGGSIEVQSRPGAYCQFDLRIPASIMVNGALLAGIGEEDIAIPLTSLDGTDFRYRDEIQRVIEAEDGCLNFRDQDYELCYLGAVRGTIAAPVVEAMPEFVPVLFAHNEERRVAFFADSLTNAEQLVIRSLGAQFTGVPGIAGGSLKTDGQPVLALDLNELIRQLDYLDTQPGPTFIKSEPTAVILCVDDSVMMRRTYEKRLQSFDYEVITAVDGEEALDYLSETKRLPDFIFTDLEMPNMNGFDFIGNVRRAPALENIPVVVVSSRDSEKHRAEAQRVGATEFIAKGANSADALKGVIERYIDAA